jgi:hypothetical protein
MTNNKLQMTNQCQNSNAKFSPLIFRFDLTFPACWQAGMTDENQKNPHHS